MKFISRIVVWLAPFKDFSNNSKIYFENNYGNNLFFALISSFKSEVKLAASLKTVISVS